MIWNKKKKLKDKREKDYLELNNKFKDKHQIVANWYMKNIYAIITDYNQLPKMDFLIKKE